MSATAIANPEKLACGHPFEAAKIIPKVDKGKAATVCTLCHPYLVGQCDKCYQWSLSLDLKKKGSEKVCADCLKIQDQIDNLGSDISNDAFLYLAVLALAVIVAITVPVVLKAIHG